MWWIRELPPTVLSDMGGVSFLGTWMRDGVASQGCFESVLLSMPRAISY